MIQCVKIQGNYSAQSTKVQNTEKSCACVCTYENILCYKIMITILYIIYKNKHQAG